MKVWKYLFSIMVIILCPVLRNSNTTGSSHFTLSLGSLIHSSDLNFYPLWDCSLIQCSPMNPTSLPGYLIRMSNQHVQSLLCCFPSQIWFSSSVSRQLPKQEKGGVILCSYFCTSTGLSSLVTPKSFINMSLPLLFFCDCFCSYHHLPGLLQNNSIDYLLVFCYPNSSSYCSWL